MELLLGSHVREHGARVGRLAGFELEPADRRIRRIIFSRDGNLVPQAATRPLAAIGHVHDGGEIELRTDHDVAPLPTADDVILLTHAHRAYKGDGTMGRLIGVEVNPADRSMLSVVAKTHWWTRLFSLDATSLDWSTPGEIRVRAPRDTQAA